MTFTVEDGTGVENANAYVAIADVGTYLADRGRDASWTGTDAVKQAAVVKATDYIEKRFGRSFIGTKSTEEQGLSWPRSDAYDRDGYLYTELPKVLTQAVCEYAVRCLTSELMYDPTKPVSSDGTQTASGEIKSKREKVGPIEEETQFVTSAEGARSRGTGLVAGYLIPAYPAADMLLEPLLKRRNTLER